MSGREKKLRSRQQPKQCQVEGHCGKEKSSALTLAVIKGARWKEMEAMGEKWEKRRRGEGTSKKESMNDCEGIEKAPKPVI